MLIQSCNCQMLLLYHSASPRLLQLLRSSVSLFICPSSRAVSPHSLFFNSARATSGLCHRPLPFLPALHSARRQYFHCIGDTHHPEGAASVNKIVLQCAQGKEKKPQPQSQSPPRQQSCEEGRRPCEDPAAEEQEEPSDDDPPAEGGGDSSDGAKQPQGGGASPDEEDGAGREAAHLCLAQMQALLKQHPSLHGAVNTLRDGARGGKVPGEADVVRALAVVGSYAASGERARRLLATLSGALSPVCVLVARGSHPVRTAAWEVRRPLGLYRDERALDAIVGSADAAAVCALLRGGGAGREMALKVIEVAGERAPRVRSAVLDAGAAPTLIALVSEERAHAGKHLRWEARGSAEKAFSAMFHCSFDFATPAQARAALPGVLDCARDPTQMTAALQAATSLVGGGTPAHLQAALDAGAARVLVDALRSDRADVESDAWHLAHRLAGGSAAQRAVMLETGVVTALCACKPPRRLRRMRPSDVVRRFAHCGGEDAEEREASTALVRDRLVPLLVSAATQDGPAADGAWAWLCAIAESADECCVILRAHGLIPLTADYLAHVRCANDRVADRPRQLLSVLCYGSPPATPAQVCEALPALLRMYQSTSERTRSTAMDCVLDVVGATKMWDGLTLAPGKCSEERAQAFLDAGFVPVIAAALKSTSRGSASEEASVATYVAAGSAQQVRCLLEAGVLQEALRHSGDCAGHYHYFDYHVLAARLVVASARHGAEGEDKDGGKGRTLLETHALPQVLEAVTDGLARHDETRQQKCLGALRVLRQLLSANAECRKTVFRHPETRAALARVAGGNGYCRNACKLAAEVLSKLCEDPPPPTVALAHKLVPLMLPLCRSKHASDVAVPALAGLKALFKVISGAVNEAWKRERLGRPRLNVSDDDVE